MTSATNDMNVYNVPTTTVCLSVRGWYTSSTFGVSSATMVTVTSFEAGRGSTCEEAIDVGVCCDDSNEAKLLLEDSLVRSTAEGQRQGRRAEICSAIIGVMSTTPAHRPRRPHVMSPRAPKVPDQHGRSPCGAPAPPPMSHDYLGKVWHRTIH
ncbi:unnamed protein product [Phytophthora fragariaefolia]|uniref:Unnamed protein product n=1 Tax=Phytophthora fragariaefolia TaxID=1490495 RepID=A0A9W7CKC0_9STRA|nr:unnamed protein product [Phytophthora fragariaefolia]